MAVVVRISGGTYDSGCVTLPTVSTLVTKRTIRVRVILLCNLTAVAQAITVTDTAGNSRLNEYPLQGHMTQTVDLGDVTMDGVKWHASNADAVNAQLIGEQP